MIMRMPAAWLIYQLYGGRVSQESVKTTEA